MSYEKFEARASGEKSCAPQSPGFGQASGAHRKSEDGRSCVDL